MRRPLLTARFIALLAFAFVATVPAAAQNPYGVSGANWAANGIMENLNMPADSWAYIWDTLQTTNRANMVRPVRYWEYVGANPNRIQGYLHLTDEIVDATAFKQWVSDNPGKVWIIGNEPDLVQQDGLSPAEYARMYHTYYTVISASDPTATFATAALSGDLPPSRVQHAINWWESMLDSYVSQFGSLPHIDIWNFHVYTLPWQLDAVATIDEYVTPFINWAHSTRSGEWASADIWCTEFGVGVWAGAMDRALVGEYMAQICPRMEAAGVDRMFWFLGAWIPPTSDAFSHHSLVYADKSPTSLGTLYSNLAHNIPNPVPTPPPDPDIRPLPSRTIVDDFDDGNADGWTVKGGEWIVDGSAYRHTPAVPYGGTYTFWNNEFYDGTFEADILIHDYQASSMNWGGFTLRQPGRTDRLVETGYLVYLRANGEVGLYTGIDGTVAVAPAAVADATSDWVRLKVEVQEYQFKVWTNGQLQLEWTDPNQRWRSGKFQLQNYLTDVSFDNVVMDPWPADVSARWKLYR